MAVCVTFQQKLLKATVILKRSNPHFFVKNKALWRSSSSRRSSWWRGISNCTCFQFFFCCSSQKITSTSSCAKHVCHVTRRSRRMRGDGSLSLCVA